MSAKGANLFRGQISPDFGLLGGGFYPSKSVVENKCFIEHPRHPFRDKNFLIPRYRIGEVCAPTKLAFHSGERFWGLSTSRRKETRQTGYNEKMRKSAYRTSQLGEPSGKWASAVFISNP